MFILLLPWILLLMLLVMIFCVFKRSWKIAIGLFIFIIGVNFWGEVIPTSAWCCSMKSNKQLKVLTWNIHGGDADTLRYERLAEKIKQENADVVFLSEVFNESSVLMDTLLSDYYPYRNTFFNWCAHYFYSKYPIMESKLIQVEGGNEVIVRGRFEINGLSLYIYGCHLSSNNYSKKSGDLQAANIDGCSNFIRYLKNISEASEQRQLECERIIGSIDSGIPVIIMGDFNDISGSNSLNILKKADFSDAWWINGYGYGATIHTPLPYRIDHILYNDKLRVQEVKKFDSEGLSDHDALIGVFNINLK